VPKTDCCPHRAFRIRNAPSQQGACLPPSPLKRDLAISWITQFIMKIQITKGQVTEIMLKERENSDIQSSGGRASRTLARQDVPQSSLTHLTSVSSGTHERINFNNNNKNKNNNKKV